MTVLEIVTGVALLLRMFPALLALSTRSLVVIFGSTFVSSESSSLSSESGSAGSSPLLASVEKTRFIGNVL